MMPFRVCSNVRTEFIQNNNVPTFSGRGLRREPLLTPLRSRLPGRSVMSAAEVQTQQPEVAYKLWVVRDKGRGAGSEFSHQSPVRYIPDVYLPLSTFTQADGSQMNRDRDGHTTQINQNMKNMFLRSVRRT